jgi:hypothetical protein
MKLSVAVSNSSTPYRAEISCSYSLNPLLFSFGTFFVLLREQEIME